MKLSSLLVFGFLVISVLPEAFAIEVTGKKVSVGNGYAYTFVDLNSRMGPISVGWH